MRNIENIVATIDHIEAHLDEPLTLGTIAGKLGYSLYHIHHMFTKTVGIPIHTYIRRRQLTEAARLLVFTNTPIVDIALQAGYDSQQAFSSIFKSMYKLPPKRFRDHKEFYPLQMPFKFEEAMVRKNPEKRHSKQTITLAREENIPEWMRLVQLVIDGFPCLNENEHIETLKRYIAQNRAFIMNDSGVTVGIMMISREAGNIDFLGVHPLYRNRNIANALFVKAMNELISHNKMSITTYREGDKADTGYRNSLQEFGFAEGELLVEFGYPTQKMTIVTDTLLKNIHNT
ncbi:MAG TPA: GNAT family N-acetyltransferase [Syntrophales bacterium]|nr:GNAT family N-acetyltransferase [Syntrophales bacterium]HPQ43992.1 GNAT family N-acetyltransferase [Syntrophales bacterium]